VILISAAALLPQSARAQGLAATPPSLSIAYSSVRANADAGQCGCFFLSGGTAEFAVPSPYRVNLVADLSGATIASVNRSPRGLSLLAFTVGPGVSFSLGRLQPFGHALIGGAHGFNSFFPYRAPQSNVSGDSVALELGGGMDIRATPRLSIRLFQADYLLTRFPNGSTNKQNSLRLGAGISIRLLRGSWNQ